MFLEQPENKTVPEGTKTTFGCTIVDTSFNIFWYVDGTDISFIRILQRGIDVIVINQTSSQLAVNATRTNNNSNIQCIAFKFQPYRRVESRMAFLVVDGKQTHMISHNQVYMYNPNVQNHLL